MQKKEMDELGRLSAEDALRSAKIPLVLVLDRVRSAMNVGSIFRTADAFAVQEMVLCGITSIPPDPEIHKTALGATESVTWTQVGSTLEAVNHLKKLGYTVWAVEQVKGAMLLNDFNPRAGQKIAVVFGHEVDGVDQAVIDACDGCLEIPQFGMKHSLNISVSAGIVIWDLWGKMKK